VILSGAFAVGRTAPSAGARPIIRGQAFCQVSPGNSARPMIASIGRTPHPPYRPMHRPESATQPRIRFALGGTWAVRAGAVTALFLPKQSRRRDARPHEANMHSERLWARHGRVREKFRTPTESFCAVLGRDARRPRRAAVGRRLASTHSHQVGKQERGKGFVVENPSYTSRGGGFGDSPGASPATFRWHVPRRGGTIVATSNKGQGCPDLQAGQTKASWWAELLPGIRCRG